MIEFSEEQELNILKRAMEYDEYLDCGSSRAVYGLNKYFVVKVGLDTGGVSQNRREIEAHRKYGDHYLARIVGYSKNIVVMERLEVYGIYEIENIINHDDWEEVPEPFINREYEVIDAVNFLQEINDETDDNYQIGISSDGKIKSYDYGFDTNKSAPEQIGSISRYIGLRDGFSVISLLADGIINGYKDGEGVLE